MNKQQLAARIWSSANQTRSKIEVSEHKDHVLGLSVSWSCYARCVAEMVGGGRAT